jgi:hypothetical protein
MSASPEDATAAEPPFDPNAKIDDFDWGKLESNFDKEMDKCVKEEVKLYEELSSLMSVSKDGLLYYITNSHLQYFDIWSKSMHSYESERAAKR